MADGKKTFLDMDFSKALASFKLPGFDLEALIGVQRKNLEAFTLANQLAAEGVQAVTRRQVELAKEAVEEASALLREMAQPGAPEELFAKNAELAKKAFEKGLAQARELAEVLSNANAHAFNIITKRVTDSFDELRESAKHKAPH